MQRAPGSRGTRAAHKSRAQRVGWRLGGAVSGGRRGERRGHMVRVGRGARRGGKGARRAQRGWDRRVGRWGGEAGVEHARRRACACGRARQRRGRKKGEGGKKEKGKRKKRRERERAKFAAATAGPVGHARATMSGRTAMHAKRGEKGSWNDDWIRVSGQRFDGKGFGGFGELNDEPKF